MISYKIKKYLRQSEILSNPNTKLNILVIGATHERYEQQLCKTGHNFFSLNEGKKWNEEYAKIPDNYFTVDYIPNNVVFDLVLCHTSNNRFIMAVEYANRMQLGAIRHTHVLPGSNDEVQAFNSMSNPITLDTFISTYSKNAWTQNENSRVIEHGLDTEVFKDFGKERELSILSVVNFWQSRDWACGWTLYQELRSKTNFKYNVLGNNPQLSNPAKSLDHLVESYNNNAIFLNTSQFSPVPMSLLEAMACGCAVVSTNTCMIPEVIQDGYNGFLCSTADEMKEKLELLHSDPSLVKTLGENARDTIESKYNIGRFCDNWNKIFMETVLR